MIFAIEDIHVAYVIPGAYAALFFILLICARLFTGNYLRILAGAASIAFTILAIAFQLPASASLSLALCQLCLFLPAHQFRKHASKLFAFVGILQVVLITPSLPLAAMANIAATSLFALVFSNLSISFVWLKIADLSLFFAVVLSWLELDSTWVFGFLLVFLGIRCSYFVSPKTNFEVATRLPAQVLVLYYFIFSQASISLLFLIDHQVFASQSARVCWLAFFGISMLLSAVTMAFRANARRVVAFAIPLYTGAIACLMIEQETTITRLIFTASYCIFPAIAFLIQKKILQKDTTESDFFLEGIRIDQWVATAALTLASLTSRFMQNILMPIIYSMFFVFPPLLNSLLRLSLRFLHNGNAQRTLFMILLGLCFIVSQFFGAV